jgi:pimeloyl-ACP methyl ester carboxylesterase
MREPTAQRTRLKTAFFRAATVGFIVLTVVSVFVAASVTGRGTRAAIGEQRLARSGDHNIAYYEAGSGPVVVMLASWARPASDFNELTQTLIDAGFRTIGVESRGIGASTGGGPNATTTLDDLASDVHAVLEHAQTGASEAVHVMGHAFGNRVARTFAMRYPGRTQSLTLIAAGGRVPVPQELTDALFASTMTFLPWSQREAAMRRTFFAEGNKIPRYWRTGWSLLGGLGQAEAARKSADAPFWSGGTGPMLVFQASDDPVAPPEAAGLALKAEFPSRVTLVEIPGASHALLPERPDQIAKACVQFLNQFR